MIFLHWVWSGVWQHRTLDIFFWEELNWSNLLWKCFCWEVHSWQTMTWCTQGLWERQRLHQWDSLPWQVERWIQNKAQNKRKNNIGGGNVYKRKHTPYKGAQKAQWVKAALAKACLDRWRTKQSTESTKMHTTYNHTHNIQKWTKKSNTKEFVLKGGDWEATPWQLMEPVNAQTQNQTA